jgi:nucleoside-diphosphate-sugar epimerase
MRILITGANGYIGRTLHNALKDTYHVDAIIRNSFDLTDPTAMSKFFQSRHNFDVVIHCAVAGGSRLQKDDWNIMDKNLIMYYNLLQFRKHYTRLIHFGSGAETYMPGEPYGYSKKVIAKSILNQDNFYNIKIFGVFDENELETRFIKGNILRYINNEPMQIHQDKTMDFFYMQDLIKVVEYYINEQEPPKEFDCVYNRIHRLSFIANIINNLDKHKVDVVISESQEATPYTSNYRNVELPIEFLGLVEGIENTYNKLQNATN